MKTTFSQSNYNASKSQSIYTTRTVWVANTGATSHITSELANLDLAATYQGTDIITTTNGTGLNIFNIGISNLIAHNHTFALKNVLHALKLL